MGTTTYFCRFRWSFCEFATLFRRYFSAFGYLCIFWAEITQAQEILFTQELENRPIAISYDEKGNFFIADAAGNLNKYDKDANFLLAYAAQNNGQITAVEAFFTQKILVFFQEQQQYIFLDRFLNILGIYWLNPDLIGFARLMTLANDGQLWIFDDTDLTLKKYNPNLDLITIKVDLSLVLPLQEYQFLLMKEYHNLLFISDLEAGIFIFDNLGNLRTQLSYPAVNAISFQGDVSYFFSENALVYYHLYSYQTKTTPLPENISAPTFVIKTDSSWVSLDAEKLHIFKIKDF